MATRRTTIVVLVKFHTSESGAEQFSLKEYVARRKERQNDIHYIMGESVDVVSTSLFLDAAGKKGFKVPILSDSVNEHVVQTLREIDAKKLKVPSRLSKVAVVRTATTWGCVEKSPSACAREIEVFIEVGNGFCQ